jgi:hypothetical protein
VLIYVAGLLVIAAVSQETRVEIIDGKLVRNRIGSAIAGLTRIGVGSQIVCLNLMLMVGPGFEFVRLKFTDVEEKWNFCICRIIHSEFSLQHTLQ